VAASGVSTLLPYLLTLSDTFLIPEPPTLGLEDSVTVLEQVEQNYNNARAQIDETLRRYSRARFDVNLTTEEAMRAENAALAELLDTTDDSEWGTGTYATYGQLVLRSPRT
jgi:hypothetical protein